MGRNAKYTEKIKIEACEKYKKGKASFRSIAQEVGCNTTVFRRWYYAYLENGEEVFEFYNYKRLQKNLKTKAPMVYRNMVLQV